MLATVRVKCDLDHLPRLAKRRRDGWHVLMTDWGRKDWRSKHNVSRECVWFQCPDACVNVLEEIKKPPKTGA